MASLCEQFQLSLDLEDVNHPSYYQTESGIEPVDVMEEFQLPGHLCMVLKYILRRGKKGGNNTELKDIRKALWWIERYLSLLERKQYEQMDLFENTLEKEKTEMPF